MQLTGDLSDFALTDILQILALSRKTGMVLLDGAGWAGKIVIESGRITEAWAEPGEANETIRTRARERILFIAFFLSVSIRVVNAWRT